METMLRVAPIVGLLAARAVDAALPNPVIDKPDCNPNMTVSIRYSTSLARLYLESGNGSTRGGRMTLTEIWEDLGGSAPLYAVDNGGEVSDTATGVWLLTESLYVQDGVTLQVHGTSAGGDADQLRLKSTNDTYINLRGHGGSLDFLDTEVFAWDTYNAAFDKNIDDGRSFISVVSEVVTDDNEDCDGRAENDMGEGRMDIENSSMAYLGFNNAESFGLSWKVRGYCTDGSNPEVFDNVNVYGNIYNSSIHHNYIGVYTYGHQQGDWRSNHVHDNSAYGFHAHDDSDFLTIHDNQVYNNGNHGIIASKRCNGVSIQDLDPAYGLSLVGKQRNTLFFVFVLIDGQGNEVHSNLVGIFLYRSGDDAIVKGNLVRINDDAGMAMMESFNATVYGNTFDSNKYGIRLSVGSANNVFSDNEIADSTKYNIYTYEGSDDPWVVNSGRPQDNVFSDNTITGSDVSIKLTAADGTQFTNNTFIDTDTIIFEDCDNILMSGNTGLDNVTLTVTGGSC